MEYVEVYPFLLTYNTTKTKYAQIQIDSTTQNTQLVYYTHSSDGC